MCVGSLYCTVVLRALSSFAIMVLRKKEKVGCFALIVLLLKCSCLYSVSRVAMDWSVV